MLDQQLLDDVTDILGWAPTSFKVVHGGYTPAARFVAANGSKSAFVKVATTSGTVAHMHREISSYSLITGPFMPRCFGWKLDREFPLLVIEDLSDALWPPPWTDGMIEAVLTSLKRMHAERPAVLVYAMVHGTRKPGWAEVRQNPRPFLSLGLVSGAWLELNIEPLVEAEALCSTEGDSLVHLDVRSDNICVQGPSATLVDWGEACLSNAKLDLGFWLPSLASEGGPPPDTLLPDAPEVAAWVSGFFAARAGLADVPDAPMVRRVQKEQLATALPWACRSLNLREQ